MILRIRSALLATALAIAALLVSPRTGDAQPHSGEPAAAGAVPSPAQPSATPRMSAADSARLDRVVRDVSMELRCPVCQGESIQESPSELAQELKAVVREQLAAGRTPDEVKAYFVGRYGEWILLRPTTSGVNVLLYWLPPAALLAGLAFVVLLARRWIRARPVATDSPLPADDVR